MSCLVTPEIQSILRKKIANNLVRKANAGEVINLEDYVREIYTFSKEKGVSENLAIDAARLVPILLEQILALKPEITTLLKKTSPRIKYEVLELSEKFEEQVEAVRDTLGLNQNVVATALMEDVKEQLDQTPEPITPVQPISVPQDLDIPTTVFTTFGPNVKSDDPKKETYLEPKPEEVRNSNVQNEVNRLLREQIDSKGILDSSQMEFPGIQGGVYFTIMTDSELDKIHGTDLSGLYKPAFGKGELLMYLSSKNGTAIKFAEDGTVNSKGKIAYYKVPSNPPMDSKGNIITNEEDLKKFLNNLKKEYPQTSEGQAVAKRAIAIAAHIYKTVQNQIEARVPQDLTKEEKKKATEEITRQVNSEYQLLDNMRKYLTANPGSSIQSTVNGGSRGFVVHNTWKPTPLSDVSFEQGFSPKVVKKEDVITVGFPEGTTYFTYPGVDEPLTVAVPSFTSKPEILNTVVSLFTENLYTEIGGKIVPMGPFERMNLIDQWAPGNMTGIKFFGKKLPGGSMQWLSTINGVKGVYNVQINGVSYPVKFDNSPTTKELQKVLAEAIREKLATPFINETEQGFPTPEDKASIGKKDNRAKAIAFGAKVVYDLKDATPGDIYARKRETGNNDYDYFTVYFPVLRIDSSLVNTKKYNEISFTQEEDKKILVADQKSYNDFLLDNFSTSAVVTPSDKKIRQINPFLSFTPSIEELPKVITSPDIVPPIIVTPKPTSDSPVTDSGIADKTTDDLMNSLLSDSSILEKSSSVKGGNARSTEKEIKDAEQWFKASPLSKHFPFKTVFAAVNTTNQGPAAQWAVHGITLFHYYNENGKIDPSKSGDFTDLYHEAWHGFTQTFLTQEQREKMYSEARNKKGSFRDYKGNLTTFKDATPWQLEEYLAEDFRAFMLSGGKISDSTSPTKNSIFRKILNFLRSLFFKASVQEVTQNPLAYPIINELYQKLRVGDLSNYNFNVLNRDQTIGVLNHALIARNADEPIQELGFEDSNLLVSTMDSIISDIVNSLNSAKETASYTVQLMRNKEHRKTVYALVKKKFENELLPSFEQKLAGAKTDFERDQANSNIQLLKYAIKEYGDIENLSNNRDGKGLIAYHQLKSKYLSEEDKESFLDDINETQQLLDAKSNQFDRGGNESSQFDLAAPEIHYLLRSIHKFDKGVPVMNRLGIQELTDYHDVWNKITRIVGGTLSRPEMEKKLLEAAYVNGQRSTKDKPGIILDPVIEEVYRKIGPVNTKSVGETELWLKFWNVFNLAEIKLVQMNIEKEKNKSDYKVTIGSSNSHSQKVASLWKNSFRTVNSEFIKRNRNLNDMVNYDKNYLDLNEIVNKFSDPKTGNLKANSQFEFFNAIGIRLSDKPQIIKAITPAGGSIGSASKILSRLKKIINERKITELYSLDDVFKEYPQDGKNPEIESESANYNNLKELETQYADYASNYMVTNAEGNTQFEQSLHNSISIMMSTLNEVDSYAELMSLPHMQYLNIETNDFARASVWLNSLFDLDNYEPGNKMKTGPKRTKVTDPNSKVQINMTNLSGVELIDENGDQGISSAKADEFTKLILDFHLNTISGRPELMRHADKGTSFSIWLSDIVGGSKDNKTYVDTVSLVEQKIPGSTDTYITGYEATANLLLPYIEAELNRINRLRVISQEDNLVYDANYLKEGQKFVIFEGVLSPKTQKELLKYSSLEQAITDNTLLLSEIKREISTYFEDQFNDVKSLMSKAEFMSSNLVTTTRIKANKEGIDTNTGRAKDALVRSFVVNSWIHNIESMSMIYGDIAQYNMNKEEFHKRNAGAGSTGTLFATDSDIIDYVNNKGRLYAKSLSKPEKKLSPTGSYDTAVLADNEIPSKYYDEFYTAMEKKFLEQYKTKINSIKDLKKKQALIDQVKAKAKAAVKPYSANNEGDAQGWITFDFYRATSILSSNWSSQQERMYNDIIEGKEIDPLAVNEFFPTRKFQYWGPVEVAEGMPPLNAFHKFSLFPLIPSVIKGTNLEQLHNKMIDQEIDYSLFKSGSKISTITKISKSGDAIQDKFYNNNEEHTFDNTGNFTKNTVFLQFLKNQLDIAPSYKGKVTFPTQMRKLIENGLMEGGVPTDFKPGLTLTKREKEWNALSSSEKLKSENYRRVKEYEADITALTELRKSELEKEADVKRDPETGEILFSEQFRKFIIKELNRQDLGEHEISFIKVGPNSKLAHDFSISLSAEKLEKILNSIVVKRLIRQKFNGEGLIQVSGAGFEQTLRGDLTKEELVKYGTNGLPFYQLIEGKEGKTQAMKVKIALQGDFKNLLKLIHTDGTVIGTRERLNEMLKNEAWLNTGDHRKMISIIGPRIPVQGLNSMEFAEVYEFLPIEAGNIVVLPTEIVAKAGSDFDIDKLTFLYPNISKEGTYDYSNTTQGGLENRIMDKMRGILEMPQNFVDFIRPNDTDIVKPIADDLSKHVMEFDPRTVVANGKKRIPGNRVFEVRYNLYKHASNNVGKQTLGLGAVDNTYNAIFNRVGARMNKEYNSAGTTRRLDILLPHNKLKDDKDQDVISLSHLMDSEGTTAISDVISQLMNGWVDIAKDAWIFNLQGNKEIAPTLLFMVQAGVPIKQAVYLVSHPLVRAYVNEQKLAKSTFAGPLGKSPGNPLFYRMHARKQILLNYLGMDKKSLDSKAEVREKYLDSETLRLTDKKTGSVIKFFDNSINPETGNAVVEDNLYSKITNKDGKFTEEDKAIFLHFLEIEDMSKSIRDVKLKTNFDTTKSNTLFEAQNKIEMLESLKKDGKIPTWIIEKILNESPIGSFYIQDFQIGLWKDLFKLRNNELVNNFILQKMNSKEFIAQVDDTWGNSEKFINQFRNDLVSFTFQNYMKNFNLDSIKDYQGINVDSSTSVELVPSLKHGVFVKVVDGQRKFFVDRTQLKKNFIQLSQQRQSVGERAIIENTMVLEDGSVIQLAGIPAVAFPNANEYYKFIFERELLRSMYPGKSGWSVLQERSDVKNKLEEYLREIPKNISESETKFKARIETLVYEETLRDMALDNTFNTWKLFKSRESMADQLIKLQIQYPELASNYSLVNNLSASIGDRATGVNRVANIMLTDMMLDADKINAFNQNLRELADPARIRVNTVSAEEKMRVAQFFEKLSTYAFLQSGLNTTGSFSLVRVVPQERFTTLMTPILESITQNMNPLTLERYYKKFLEISSNKKMRSRFRDYTLPKFNPASDRSKSTGKKPNEIVSMVYETQDQPKRFTKDNSGNLLYYGNPGVTIDGDNISGLTQSEANNLVEANPKIAFVMNGTMGSIAGANTNESTLINTRESHGNVIPLPVRNSFGASDLSKIKDIPVSEVAAAKEEEESTTDSFRYFGAFYNIKLVGGVAIDVIDYKGKDKNKNKILVAYANNPDMDPQGRVKFRGAPAIETGNYHSVKFADGTEIDTPFPLNTEQIEALLALEDFYNNPRKYENQITLLGYAGTGKTSIIGIFDKFLRTRSAFQDNRFHGDTYYSSPTHRANAVTKLKNPRAKVLTLHSLFGLSGDIQLEDGDYTLENLEFAQKNKVKIEQGDILIVDEASMVNKTLYNFLNKFKKSLDIKIIYVGDPAQLKPVKEENVSVVFSTGKQVQLTKVERTGDNPILEESTNLRNGQDLNYQTKVIGTEGVEYLSDNLLLRKIISDNYGGPEFKKNKLYFRILAAKNATVDDGNKVTRELLFGEEAKNQLVLGDILMGYNNFDVDYTTKEPKIINSGDYEVTNMTSATKTISINGKAVTYKGFNVTLSNLLNPKDNSKHIFIADNNESNDKLTAFADEVSRKNILGKQSMMKGDRRGAAKLFSEARDLESQIAFMKGVKDINGRLKVKKTLDYGYTHTIHKSQGGTYNKVMILADTISAPFDIQTQQQLKYVAMSRASEYVYIKTAHTLKEPIIKDAPLKVQAPVDSIPTTEEETKKIATAGTIKVEPPLRDDVLEPINGATINPQVKAKIDATIQSMLRYQEEGYKLAFPATGFGQYMIGADDLTGELKQGATPIARATFVYLSQQLYEKFKYVNPNMEQALYQEGLKNQVQAESPVTDEEVMDSISFCFKD